MKRTLLGTLVLGFALAASPALAQSQAPADDAAALQARCEAGAADATQLATCLWVVATVLAPVPGPSPVAYGADLPGAGVLLSAEDKDVTLVEVDWNAKGRSAPEKGNRYVALRVLYQAKVDGASYNPFDWSAVDLEGFAYDQAYGVKSPALQSSNDLPAGRKAQGWVAFQVPKAVKELEVVASVGLGGYLRWLITAPS